MIIFAYYLSACNQYPGSFLAPSGVKSVRNRNLLSLLSVAIWFISNLKMPPRRSNRRRVNAGPSKRRRIDGSPERVGLASTETATTEDGHLHSEHEGTSGNATGVSQPKIQSEPSIENFVDFEKILTASEVIQEKKCCIIINSRSTHIKFSYFFLQWRNYQFGCWWYFFTRTCTIMSKDLG